MKETIHAKRVFKATNPNGKGIVVATAQFYSLGDQAPYFSITTDHGCDHETILKAMPHLKPLVDVHLCGGDGQPMHALANGKYHLDNRNVKGVCSHFMVDEDTAKSLIDEYGWATDDNATLAIQTVQRVEEQIVDKLLKDIYPVLLPGGRGTNYNFHTLGEEIKKTLRTLYGSEMLNLRNHSSNVMRKLKPNVEFFKNPTDPKWYVGSRVPSLAHIMHHAGILGDFYKLYKAYSYGLYSPRHSELNDEIIKMRGLIMNMLNACRTDQQSVRGLQRRYDTQYVQDLIDECFVSCWQRRADVALEMLEGEDDELDAECDPEDALVIYAGDVIPIEETMDYDLLPMINVGGYEFYVAQSTEDAGEAAEQYWRDMAKHDKSEFKCLVGEENLLAWALGESAGPGSTKVTSLEEWFNLTSQNPEEQWARYDGEETYLLINEATADKLGWGFVPYCTEHDMQWMKVVAYKT